jgi:hypothetical protein
MPSLNGYPKPGVLVMANDGVSDGENESRNKLVKYAIQMTLARPIQKHVDCQLQQTLTLYIQND